MKKYILSIDQGTTSTRAIIFNADMQVVAIDQQALPQHYPRSGWVEHDPEDLWQTTLTTCQAALHNAQLTPADIAGIGISNQRETTVVWDKNTGKPVYNAIVWQDRRTADICDQLRHKNESFINMHTGLRLDPYFSASKLQWILDNVEGAREKAENKQLLFGTVDSFLIWRLSGGKMHVTDATNAARTMLYNIRLGIWDNDICRLFKIPMHMLPSVKDCAAEFGVTDAVHFGGEIPILGVAGDQQAAAIGQACFTPGMMKSTYGTGCFALLNTGETLVRSNNRLLGTIAYQLNGQVTYALEGSIMIAGAVIQWLQDGLKIIDNAEKAQHLAQQADVEQQVYLVPAFTGLGAPYWDSHCRGAIYGLTRNSGAPELCRAALESVAYQTKDLFEAMREDWHYIGGQSDNDNVLRIDGGMSASDWTMQFLADMLDAPIDRPKIVETTAMGVAWLAGMQAGIYAGKDEFAKHWHCEKRFMPDMAAELREKKYAGWQTAIKRTLVE
ncbi:MAG: glycerol kinase [Gammaproteobacteria bacterium]|nr:MAG: glycerol kinase [Gammaproteobacteria bacterium]